MEEEPRQSGELNPDLGVAPPYDIGEELGLKPANPESTAAIREILQQDALRAKAKEPEVVWPTDEERETGKEGIESARKAIRNAFKNKPKP